jgi:FkbH-like protein
MVQRQLLREDQRKHMPSEEFLQEANPDVTMVIIDTTDHPRFARAFELLNKTNQYNTTGRRWAFEEPRASLRSGARMYAFEVEDRYTDYGLVGVVIVSGSTIERWVMSCRVLGYEIEEAVCLLSCDVFALRTTIQFWDAWPKRTSISLPLLVFKMRLCC